MNEILPKGISRQAASSPSSLVDFGYGTTTTSSSRVSLNRAKRFVSPLKRGSSISPYATEILELNSLIFSLSFNIIPDLHGLSKSSG